MQGADRYDYSLTMIASEKGEAGLGQADPGNTILLRPKVGGFPCNQMKFCCLIGGMATASISHGRMGI